MTCLVKHIESSTVSCGAGDTQCVNGTFAYLAGRGGPTQQAQHFDPKLALCWDSVADGGPTLSQLRDNMICLLVTIVK